jgi:uncharacterized protein
MSAQHNTRWIVVAIVALCVVLVVVWIRLTGTNQRAAKAPAYKVPPPDTTGIERLHESSLSSIKPLGWIAASLRKQASGLTGHLDEVVGYPFNTDCWMGKPVVSQIGSDWWPYEQSAYWIDGMFRCGALISDACLLKKSSASIEYVLRHPAPDGSLGPALLKGRQINYKWPHTVFFRSVMAYQSYYGDSRTPDIVRRHFLSLKDPLDSIRNVTNIEIILWAYGKTGDPRLLTLAKRAYAAFNRSNPRSPNTRKAMLSSQPPKGHGVTYNEMAKLPAILYLYTGDESYLKSAIHAYDKLEHYQQLADGVCSSSESLRGTNPLDSHETCDIADYTWYLGYLMLATGRVKYADQIEKACFNAAFGATTPDFRALQYFSCPNQVICTSTSDHNAFVRGSARMSYRPEPGLACCSGNVNRILPNYVSRMWLTDSYGNPVAMMYGPSEFAFHPRDKVSAKLTETTNYPFSDTIIFRVSVPEPAKFIFRYRVPGWCTRVHAMFNRRTFGSQTVSRGIASIERVFRNGDEISLRFESKLRVRHWPKGGISIEKGPIVYSLPVPTDRSIDRSDAKSTPSFPAWNMRPNGPWNYALLLDREGSPIGTQLVTGTVGSNPWQTDAAPLRLRVRAVRVPFWRLQSEPSAQSARRNLYTPPLPDHRLLQGLDSEDSQLVTLVPYGATRLRFTVFPYVKMRR